MKKFMSMALIFTTVLATNVFAEETQAIQNVASQKVFAQESMEEISVVANYTEFTEEVTAMQYDNGVYFFPVRAIADKFGVDVLWDAETDTATIVYKEYSVKLTDNSSSVIFNESVIEGIGETTRIDGSLYFGSPLLTLYVSPEVSFDEATGVTTATFNLDSAVNRLLGING